VSAVGVQLRIEGQDDTLQSGFIPLTDCSTGSDAVKILSLSQFKIFSEALFKICYSFEDNESLSVTADSFHSNQYTKLDEKAHNIVASIRRK